MTSKGSIDAILDEIAQAADGVAPAVAPAAPEARRRLGSLVTALPSDAAARHQQFHEPTADWGALNARDDATFIRDAYQIALGRPADAKGFTELSEKLANGAINRLGVLRSLLDSDEARGRDVAVRGMGSARLLQRAERLPVIGRVVRLLAALVRLPWHLAVLERRLALGEERERRLAGDVDRLVADVNLSLTGARATFAIVERDIDQLSSYADSLAMDGTERDARMDGIDGRIDGVDERISGVDERIDGVDATIIVAGRLADSKLEEAKATHRKTLIEAGHLAEVVGEARKRLPPQIDSGDRDRLAAIEEHELDDLYLAFENKFRGAPEEISRRCLRYLPMMAATPAVAAGGLVLDIGCGRGEWLSLLRDQGHACRGIDLNVAMVAAATERGHDVVAGDAIAYLRGLPENSLGAVTGFHIVEHLPFRVLIRLLDEANRALMPGGAILFETPNPECLVVGACNFYYDPTHQNPLPPELLRFLANARAFSSSRVIRLDGDCDLEQPESGFAPTDINAWFQMPMDYAVYARKA